MKKEQRIALILAGIVALLSELLELEITDNKFSFMQISIFTYVYYLYLREGHNK